MAGAEDESWRPPHAYLPGETPRHEEDAFDGLKTGIDPADLAASRAWRMGLAFYDDGFFWEAHELWEAVWMAAPANSREKRLVQAMIQAANARLKVRMGRANAARRLWTEAEALLRAAFAGEEGPLLGITAAEAREMIANEAESRP